MVGAVSNKGALMFMSAYAAEAASKIVHITKGSINFSSAVVFGSVRGHKAHRLASVF